MKSVNPHPQQMVGNALIHFPKKLFGLRFDQNCTLLVVQQCDDVVEVD